MRGLTPFLTTTLILLLTAATLPAETLSYKDNWAPQGLNLVSNRADGLELIFSLESWELGQEMIQGEALHTVRIPQVFLPNEAGAPDLPALSRMIALPNGATASLEILDVRVETLTGINLAPAPRLPLETEDGPLDYRRDNEIYMKDAFYPESPVILGEAQELRGVNMRTLGLTPFQYNPVSRELKVLRDIRVALRFEGGDGHFGQDNLRSRWWDPILRGNLLNADMLPEIEYRVDAGLRTPDYEYVIITPDDASFTAWADSIRHFRNEQGIYTGVYSVSEVGGNTTSAIEDFVDAAYGWDYPPSAFLLMADYGDGATGITSPLYYYDYTAISDNIYADVSGDGLPEFAFARMTAQNPQHLQTFIGKALDYERTPPTAPSFYEEPIIAGGWQTERWFILCNEVIYGYLYNELGKDPVREYAIYSGSPSTTWSTATNTGTVVNYFGPSGLGYIPSTPAHLNDWGGNATRLNADINSGAFLLQHRDHGGQTGWGEPDYGNSDLGGLSNEDLTFVLSINCLTGKFNYSGECFTEAFHRHAQGALGLVAASETSYSFVNDTYVWGMFDYFWPDFMPEEGSPGQHRLLPAFGNVAGKVFLAGSSWPYNTVNKQDTYHLFHHHGDAFTTVYSEIPSAIMVSHDPVLLAGLEEFPIMAETGSLIGISRDGEYIASATGMGLPQNVSIPPQEAGTEILVTVTLQNHYRYSQVVTVVPPEGAYLVYEEAAVLDETGDDDGMLDEGEDAGLTLVLENVGNETSTGVTVTLSTEDPLVDILVDTQSYSDIASGAMGGNAAPFELHVEGIVPDGHEILFSYEAVGNEGSWDGDFVLVAQAPDLAGGGQFVNDAVPDGDGSGTADAGETFQLRLDVLNGGASDCGALTALLSCADPNVSVLEGTGACAAIPVGGMSTTDYFRLEISPLYAEPGLVDLSLELSGEDGFTATLEYQLPVGGWLDDFESDQGWTVQSTASTGIWTRVDPLGTTYEGYQIQPEDDHTPTGTMCFVTGQGTDPSSAGENDVDGGATTLYSPVFRLDGAATATVSYWRWYTNARGNNPNADYWTVEVTDDGLSWVQLEHTMATDESWTQFTFELSDYVALTDMVQVRFIADDSADASLVEAAVDDFFLDAAFPILTGVGEDGDLPARLALRGNFPNPFNPETTIRFDLPAAGEVSLAVYDVRGRLVRTLHQGSLDAGQYEVVWDGRDEAGKPSSSGVYFSRLLAGERDLTRKMVLLK